MRFKTPKEASDFLAMTHTEVKAEIEANILRLLAESGGEIAIRPNERMAYPSVYSDSGPASVVSIRAITTRNGRVAVKADIVTTGRRPIGDSFSIGEMLQLWTIAIENTQNK